MATPSTMQGIYAILNNSNGKLYVGSAVHFRNRWALHRRQLAKGKHHSAPLQNAYAKHGNGVFDFSIIEYVDRRSDLLSREQVWLDFFRPAYNVAKFAGSPMLGMKASEETKAKMSAASKGRKRPPFTDEWKANISASKVGKKPNISDEVREKLRLSRIGNKSFLGRTFTAEHRRNLSMAKIGNANAKGFKYPPEAYSFRRIKQGEVP